MSEVVLPDSIATELRDLKRRLRNLETAPRLTNASMADEDGNQRVVLGRQADGTYGIEVRDAAGRIMFKVAETGMDRPVMNIPVRVIAEYPTTTSADWATLWALTFTQISATGLSVTVEVDVAAGTTAEVRLLWAGGAKASGVRTVAGPPSGPLTWKWEPGWQTWMGTYGVTHIDVQIRRVAGSAPVGVFEPWAFVAPADEIGATPTGL